MFPPRLAMDENTIKIGTKEFYEEWSQDMCDHSHETIRSIKYSKRLY